MQKKFFKNHKHIQKMKDCSIRSIIIKSLVYSKINNKSFFIYLYTSLLTLCHVCLSASLKIENKKKKYNYNNKR